MSRSKKKRENELEEFRREKMRRLEELRIKLLESERSLEEQIEEREKVKIEITWRK